MNVPMELNENKRTHNFAKPFPLHGSLAAGEFGVIKTGPMAATTAVDAVYPMTRGR